MPPAFRNPFADAIRPFSTLTICAIILITLNSLSTAQAQTNPPFWFDPTAVMSDQLSGYDPFTAKSQDGWAYLTFVQWSGQEGEGQIMAFQIALGEYNATEGDWRIYAEGTADYLTALPHLPAWLQWLTQLEAQRERNPTPNPTGTYSIPGLPWKPDTAWRYNQGPLTANHLNAFDFGVPISGIQNDVYFAEDGVVIGTNGTCIIVERPSDGLRHFYQHIEPSDLFQFSFGEPVTYKQKLGRTTLISGCGGTTTGHHLHFAFYTPFGGPIINPQGFTMNDWQVVGNTLVKEDEVALPNFTDTVLHDATIFYEEFNSELLSPEWFWVRQDDTNWSLAERPNFLRIYTQEGTLLSNDTPPKNLLLRTSMRTTYEVIVRFEGEFTEDFHQAMLILYNDDDNYLILGRIFDDVNQGEDTYVLRREEKGETAAATFTTEATEITTTLRLIVTDSFVMAFYQNDNGDWISLGQILVNGLERYPHLGLSAYHGLPETPASPVAIDFDYMLVRPIEVWRTYLPFVQRSS